MDVSLKKGTKIHILSNILIKMRWMQSCLNVSKVNFFRNILLTTLNEYNKRLTILNESNKGKHSHMYDNLNYHTGLNFLPIVIG